MQITLTEEERKLCEHLGMRRTMNNRKHGVKKVKKGDKDMQYYDIVGTCGEFAFTKMWSAPFDDTIYVRSGGADTEINGYTIDVKATDVKNGRLLANQNKVEHPVDIYTLMFSEDGYTWSFLGWATSDELLRPENLRRMSPKYPESYALDQSQLRSPDSLLYLLIKE